VPVLPYTIYVNRMNPQHPSQDFGVSVFAVLLLAALCDLSLHWIITLLGNIVPSDTSPFLKTRQAATFLQRHRLTLGVYQISPYRLGVRKKISFLPSQRIQDAFYQSIHITSCNQPRSFQSRIAYPRQRSDRSKASIPKGNYSLCLFALDVGKLPRTTRRPPFGSGSEFHPRHV
jgi:hypothetical protein